MTEEEERSASGAPIYRHRPPAPPAGPAASGEFDGAIRAHVEEHLGPIQATFQELVSERVKLDLLVVGPALGREHYTLVTSGMSARPMLTPEGMEECCWAELVLCLPLDWPVLQREALEDEDNYWPLRWLKTLARFPHEYGTWLSFQHTVPNGDPPRPFAQGTELCSMLLLDPVLAPPEFARLEVGGDREVQFFAAIPLYLDELQLKLEEGAEALELRLRKAGVTELIDPRRPSVAPRGGEG